MCRERIIKLRYVMICLCVVVTKKKHTQKKEVLSHAYTVPLFVEYVY